LVKCSALGWVEDGEGIIPEEQFSFKERVARSFSLAADSYDCAAQLQRRVGSMLLEMVPNIGYQKVLDLGSGTGYYSRKLMQDYSIDTLVGLDLAEGMSAYSSKNSGGSNIHWCCGDAESLPINGNSIDLVFSNLMLQWCAGTRALGQEMHRVLRDKGEWVFSTLGPGTLEELRQAWANVDNYVHVNSFISKHEIEKQLVSAGLTVEVHQCKLVMQYSKLSHLTRDLKGIGANNVNPGRARGLTASKRLKALSRAYDTFRNDQGMLPATYVVYLARARKQ